MLFWNNQKNTKVVLINKHGKNVTTFRMSTSYSKYTSYCALAATNIPQYDANPAMLCDFMAQSTLLREPRPLYKVLKTYHGLKQWISILSIYKFQMLIFYLPKRNRMILQPNQKKITNFTSLMFPPRKQNYYKFIMILDIYHCLNYKRWQDKEL